LERRDKPHPQPKLLLNQNLRKRVKRNQKRHQQPRNQLLNLLSKRKIIKMKNTRSTKWISMKSTSNKNNNIIKSLNQFSINRSTLLSVMLSKLIPSSSSNRNNSRKIARLWMKVENLAKKKKTRNRKPMKFKRKRKVMMKILKKKRENNELNK
jgi:hypothetical protein